MIADRVGGVETLAATQAAAGNVATSVEFIFTGLCVFELWQKTKKMHVSLIHAARSGIKESHSATMMIRLGDFEPQRNGYQSPQIVKLGSETLGIWGLTGKALWIEGVNGKGFDTDGTPNLNFRMAGAGGVLKESERQDASNWEGLVRFPNLADVVGTPVPALAPDKVTARILMTRGDARGLKPSTPCELARSYGFTQPEDVVNDRSYASEFAVTHPATSDVLVLVIADLINGRVASSRRRIGLKVRPGQKTPVSIANIPVGRHDQNIEGHFAAYARALGSKGKTLFAHEHCTAGSVGMMMRGRGDENPSAGLNPPEAGCIPPGILRD